MIAISIVGFLFTYWIASDVFCLLLLRAFDIRDRERLRDVFFLTRGIGPIAISWLLFHFVLLAPRHEPAFYVTATAACCAAALYFGRTRLACLLTIYRDLAGAARRHGPPDGVTALLAGLVAAVALFIVCIGVSFPIVEGDALGFAQEARLIYRDLSFENYPTVNADAETGYHYDTFQVPCLQMLYVWFFLLTQTSAVDVLARTVAPMYALYTALLLAWALYRRTASAETALWGCLALIAAPLFATESYYNTQDPHRIYLFFSALLWLEIAVGATTMMLATLLLGLFVGLAIYGHFAGLMLLAIVPPLYFWRRRRRPGQALVASTLIVLVAVFVGGAHHYLRPVAAQRVLLQFPSMQPMVRKVLAPLGLEEVLPHKTVVVSPKAYDWLASRRGQQSWLTWLLFAKLQLFTGVEWFGLLFWFAAAGILGWLKQPHKTTLDSILAAAALLCTVIVLCDFRKMASSNPRYIATILPNAAYFAAMTIAAITHSRRWGDARRMRALGTGLMMMVIVGPLLVTSAVRGAKIGLTNPGNLYEAVHSMNWVGDAVRHPISSLKTFCESYLGIRETLAYFAAGDAVKLQHTHDSFAAINYMRTSTPPTAAALAFRSTRYFYYSERRGISYTDPRMETFSKISAADEACRFLAGLGIDHVLLDSYYATYPMYTDTKLMDILSDPKQSTKVYEYGSAQVYKLHCSGGAAAPDAPADE
jgi:hypothetical protein